MQSPCYVQVMRQSQLRIRRIVEARRLFREGEATRIRTEAGISQAEFSKGVGVSPATISLWESGGRSPIGEHALKSWALLMTLQRAGEK